MLLFLIASGVRVKLVSLDIMCKFVTHLHKHCPVIYKVLQGMLVVDNFHSRCHTEKCRLVFAALFAIGSAMFSGGIVEMLNYLVFARNPGLAPVRAQCITVMSSFAP